MEIINIVIYLDFHSTQWALWSVDSWSLALDQIQMFPNQDTIAQLLPARRIQQHVISALIFSTCPRQLDWHTGIQEQSQTRRWGGKKYRIAKRNSQEGIEWTSGEFLAERNETERRQLQKVCLEGFSKSNQIFEAAIVKLKRQGFDHHLTIIPLGVPTVQLKLLNFICLS